MNKGKIFILSGPSGSGKTTLYKKLISDPAFKNKLVKSTSITTRPPRKGERRGKDYVFVSPKMFRYKIRAGHFLEWQKVFDNYYGTPKKKVREILNRGRNVLLCIDVEGAKVVLRQRKDCVTIFVKPPNVTVLKKRLLNRGSEVKDVLSLRLKVAKKEMAQAHRYQHVIVNDNLNKAYRRLKTIILRHMA